LPFKIFRNNVVLIYKIRSAAFDLLNNPIQRNFGVEREQTMDMILHAIDGFYSTSHFQKLIAHVLVNRAFLIQMNEKVSVFGGPHSVDPDANIRVGHRKKFAAKIIPPITYPTKLAPINYRYIIQLKYTSSRITPRPFH
jgi:hypothetical protein